MIDYSYFKQLVEARIAELAHNQARDHAVDSVELDQTRVGRLSRIDALQMQQMQLALSRRQQQELAALDSALKRIDDEEFGECMECGEEINPKRLEVDLSASLCITCAQLRENQ